MRNPVFSPAQPWLAPLAGWSDLPFRLLCREQGAAVCCTEMISAKGLVYGGAATRELLAVSPEDTPLVAKLFGAEPSFMAEAAKRLLDMGFAWFDCNMGCSVPKVTRTGAGAALCRDTDRARRIAEALIRVAGEGRVGFKLRLGWDSGRPAPSRTPTAVSLKAPAPDPTDTRADTRADTGADAGAGAPAIVPAACGATPPSLPPGETWRELGVALAGLGAGWLTLHPRTAKQGFTGEARWSAVAELKRLVSVPVIASGDLFTAHDGIRCLAETGADAVMYARGALRDPAIFAAHRRLAQGEPAPEPDAAALFARIRRHAELARSLTPPRPALLKMRTIVPRYARGLEHARSLRLAVIACRSWEEFDEVIARFENAALESALVKAPEDNSPTSV